MHASVGSPPYLAADVIGFAAGLIRTGADVAAVLAVAPGAARRGLVTHEVSYLRTWPPRSAAGSTRCGRSGNA
jgi:hypothetical protein